MKVSELFEAGEENTVTQVNKVLKGLGYRLDSRESTPGESKSWWKGKNPTTVELAKALQAVDPSIAPKPNYQFNKAKQMENSEEVSGKLMRASFQGDNQLFVAVFKKTKIGALSKRDYDAGLDPSARFESVESVTEDWAKDQAIKNRAIIKARRDADKSVRDGIKAHNKLVDKQEREAKTGADLQKVYNKIIAVISSTFPDGDPIDTLAPWLKKQGIEGYEIGETITAAMKKFGHGSEKKGMYEYMADMWDDSIADAMHDAKNLQKKGEKYDSPFVRYEGNTPVARNNPWK